MKLLRLRLSQISEDTKVRPRYCDGSRSVFADIPLEVGTINTNHSHGYSAAVRTALVTFIRTYCLRMGRPEYCISMSARDQRDGCKGERLYYWAKDLDKEVRMDAMDGIVSMVDVDYHMSTLEFEDLLARASEPIIIATINPTKVAKTTGEAIYNFTSDNEIDMRYAGGAHYTHELYDYTQDTLTVKRSAFGFTYFYKTFSVEKRQIDDLRQVVLLTPVGSWTGFGAHVTALRTPEYPLRRLRPVTEGWAHIASLNKGGVTHSVGEADTQLEASFTGIELAHCLRADTLAKAEASVSTCSQWLGGDRERAVVMAGYLRTFGVYHPKYVANVNDAVKHVSGDTQTFGDGGEEKITVQSFMSPLIDGGAFAHVDSEANNRWAVESRLLDVQEPARPLRPFVATCLKDFVNHLARKGPLTPVDTDEVRANQTRPTQKARHEEGVNAGPSEDSTIKAFNKKEAASGPSDPRNISTYAPGISIDYSRYTYAITKALKEEPWYGFGAPPQIAERVVEVVMDAKYAIEGDFSRMDGRVNGNVRECLEEAVLRQWFPDDPEVLRLHNLQFNQKGRTKGMSYRQGFSRGSGSPETSCFNTMTTAATAYLKNRMLGLNHADSISKLGIYAGDDALEGGIAGFSSEEHADAWRRAARQMGQVLTGDVRMSGDPIMFLARNFGGAWYGSTSSMADIRRVLWKIHCTSNMPAGITPETKCYEKGASLHTTDANSPILGPLASKMMSVTGAGRYIESMSRDQRGYWSSYPNSFPNEYEPWMDEYVSNVLPDFNLDYFNEWIKGGDVLRAPVCYAVAPEEVKQPSRDVMVDGELVRSKPKAKKPKRTKCAHGKGLRSKSSRAGSISGSSSVSSV